VVVTPDKDQFTNGLIDGYRSADRKMLCANLPLLDWRSSSPPPAVG
jgi:hypothetical protein